MTNLELLKSIAVSIGYTWDEAREEDGITYLFKRGRVTDCLFMGDDYAGYNPEHPCPTRCPITNKTGHQIGTIIDGAIPLDDPECFVKLMREVDEANVARWMRGFVPEPVRTVVIYPRSFGSCC